MDSLTFQKIKEFIVYARKRAEESKGTDYEWDYEDCKHCLFRFALEYPHPNHGIDDIIDEFEELPPY